MIDVRNRKPLTQQNKSQVKGITQNKDSVLSRMNRRENNNFGNSTRSNIYNTLSSNTPLYKPDSVSDATKRREKIQEIHDRQSTDSRVRNEARQNRNRINMGTQTRG